jgi:hypothetical protein
MNLKKTDKIIAGVAVLVLIVAAIGIIFYTTYEGDDVDDEIDETEIYFEVICEEKTVPNAESMSCTLSVDKGLIIKKALIPKTKSFEGLECVSIHVDNLKSVEFKITYTDANHGGLLGKVLKSQGYDSLNVKIIDPAGTEHDGEAIVGTGNGNITITIDNINSKINVYEIKADSYDEAETELEKQRLLLKLLTERNAESFDVEVTYTYYKYHVEEVEDDNDNDEDKETVITQSYGGQYRTSSLGRDFFG